MLEDAVRKATLSLPFGDLDRQTLSAAMAIFKPDVYGNRCVTIRDCYVSPSKLFVQKKLYQTSQSRSPRFSLFSRAAGSSSLSAVVTILMPVRRPTGLLGCPIAPRSQALRLARNALQSGDDAARSGRVLRNTRKHIVLLFSSTFIEGGDVAFSFRDAQFRLSFDAGHSTRWCFAAAAALRMLSENRPIGSGCITLRSSPLSVYQLAFVTQGILPLSAMPRQRLRQHLKLRM